MGRRHEQTFLQRRHTEVQETHEKMLNITRHQGNANQNYITSHLSQWLISTTQEETDVGENAEKGETHALLVGMQTGAATVENSVEVPQKIKKRSTL